MRFLRDYLSSPKITHTPLLVLLFHPAGMWASFQEQKHKGKGLNMKFLSKHTSLL